MADCLPSRTLLEPDSTRAAAIRSGLRRLQQAPRGITSLPFLSAAEIDLLIADAKVASYRTATPEIEHRGRRVHQDFDVCFPAPRTGVFAALADCLETCLRSADAAAAHAACLLGVGTHAANNFTTTQVVDGGGSVVVTRRDSTSRHSGAALRRPSSA